MNNRPIQGMHFFRFEHQLNRIEWMDIELIALRLYPRLSITFYFFIFVRFPIANKHARARIVRAENLLLAHVIIIHIKICIIVIALSLSLFFFLLFFCLFLASSKVNPTTFRYYYSFARLVMFCFFVLLLYVHRISFLPFFALSISVSVCSVRLFHSNQQLVKFSLLSLFLLLVLLLIFLRII